MLRSSMLILPLALMAACSTTGNAGSAGTGGTPAQAELDTRQLTANHWTLTDAVDGNGKRLDALFPAGGKAMVMNFEEGRLNARGSCNTLMGSYTVRGNQLHVGTLASTMIGCPDPLQGQDRLFGTQFEAAGTLQQLDDRRMVVRSAAGNVLTFTATPTAETRYDGPGQRVFLEVGAHTKPCQHPLIDNMQCLQVREIHYDANGIKQGTPGEFTHFHDQIEGYTHQPGVRNVLRLKRFTVKNPPADASSVAYVLDMVVETERVDR